MQYRLSACDAGGVSQSEDADRSNKETSGKEAKTESTQSDGPTPMEETAENPTVTDSKESESSAPTQAAGDGTQIEPTTNKEAEESTAADVALLQAAAAEALSSAAVKAKVGYEIKCYK